MPEYDDFQKLNLRRVDPQADPKTLSEKLIWVAQERKTSALWVQREVGKLVPLAQKLEQEKLTAWAVAGICAAVLVVILLRVAT